MRNDGPGRRRTPAERDQLLVNQLVNLSAALDAAESGGPAAFPAIATWLRPLVGTDRALHSWAHERGLPIPSVVVSRPPDNGADVVLSVGLLPAPARDPQSEQLSVKKWMGKTAIRLRTPDGRLVTMSWAQLVSAVANEQGAHLSPDVAEVFDHAQVLQMSGLTLECFALRQIGIIVEDLVEQMLASTGEHPLVGRHARNGELNGVCATWVSVRRTKNEPLERQYWIDLDGQAIDLRREVFRWTSDGIELGASLDGSTTVRVLGMPPSAGSAS